MKRALQALGFVALIALLWADLILAFCFGG